VGRIYSLHLEYQNHYEAPSLGCCHKENNFTSSCKA
jgi:hypothetical protein